MCAPHRSYGAAMAPPIAAAFLGIEPPTIEDLLTSLDWPTEEVTLGVVEPVGGPRSPIAADGDSGTPPAGT